MLFGWYRVFWSHKKFFINYSAVNRGVAASCFLLLMIIYIFYRGTAGILFNPISIFFFAVIEIFLFVMFSLMDSFVFDFSNKKIKHSYGFLILVRKHEIKFADIRHIELQQIVKERFIDALQTGERRNSKKYYQLNFTTKTGVHYQIGYFDEKKRQTLIRVAEEVRKD